MRSELRNIVKTVARRYQHTSPNRFGRYPILPPSLAISVYPESLDVPRSIPRPNYVPANFFDAPWGDHDVVDVDERDHLCRGVELRSGDELRIRKVASMAASTLTEIGKLVKVGHWDHAKSLLIFKPGVTTEQLDAALHQMIIDQGAYPSPLGYGSFPKSCCTSINNVIARESRSADSIRLSTNTADRWYPR